MSKYNSKKAKRIINSEIVNFDSKLEAERYDYLYLLLRASKIRQLRLQVNFILQDKFKHKNKTVQAITYTPDFVYEKKVKDKWIKVVDDAKGMLTEPTRLRQKMFLLRFGKEYECINTKKVRQTWIEKDF